ncbi:MAG: hypothetical protein H6732_04025 [Alphaproteobacteria bacterium]|nr:hypothetical protein [Alphaproteobacteria bacterium]
MLRQVLWLLAVCWASIAVAGDPPPPFRADEAPPELRAWVDWVQARTPELACPVVAGSRACVWPGVLTVDVRGASARLRLRVHTDRHTTVPLPGGPGAWPQDLRTDGRPAPVLATGDTPVVVLGAGEHDLDWTVAWATRPASLALPPHVGRVELTLDGVGVDQPLVDGEGLHLGAVQVDAREGERLDLEVARRIVDGVPVMVHTRVTLRASGRAREVDLGDVLLPGTRAVQLSATLPARFTPDGTLLVQVRPGSWEIAFAAIHDGPVTALTRPASTAPWPALETWAFQPDERVRAVEVDGPPGIDPTRTTLPGDWQALAAFSVDGSTPLTFTELRRGDPEPPPNTLTLQRTLWLDLDGGGLTAQDHFEGQLARGWRLDVMGEAELGHVQLDGTDQVITRGGDGQAGVELRRSRLQLTAESRFSSRPTTLPAVGWDTDVQQLGITLNLPPGWTLLAAQGVDSLDGSVLDAWTLFDLFFVLVLAMATMRLLGVQWGAFMLALLVLTRHTPDAPQWAWAVLLVVQAVSRVVKAERVTRLLVWLRGGVVLVLLVLLAPFVQDEVQGALFPALQDGSGWHGGWGAGASPEFELEEIPDQVKILRFNQAEETAYRESDKPAEARGAGATYATVDPNAVVQTGPGVPTWSWNSLSLTWSGPVSAEHTLRLHLLGPGANLVLSLLRVVLAVLLALRLGGVPLGRWLRAPPSGAVVAALLGALLLPAAARAEPSQAALDELAARLAAPAPCGEACVDVPDLGFVLRGDVLRIEAQVHVGATRSWPVPGPTKTWVPARVRVDGRDAVALARQPDGHLHVRLEPGVHTVEVEGPLPPTDALVLAFGLRPHHVHADAPGWVMDGVRADGTPEASVQIARVVGTTTGTSSAENLAPWLEVHRALQLGIPWTVTTTVRRAFPGDQALALRVPLLPGEAVTTGGFEPVDGVLPVALARDHQAVTWTSTLPTVDQLVLTAPEGVPWSETWTLDCSPIFSCSPTGPAPVHHAAAGRWLPRWLPWPGEALTLDVIRPAGVEGQTTTIDRALLTVRPGRRQLLATLDLSLRSSRGGRQEVTLPEGAVLQSVTLDGVARPLRMQGRVLGLPVQPGAQEARVTWQQERAPTVYDRVPEVHVGGPAVNVQVVVEPPPERWIAALRGPLWGPVPLFWSYVLVVAGAAWLLARVPWSPLGFGAWLLLGLGMTQVPAFCPAVVALWLVALGWRKARPLEHPLAFDLLQVGLVGLTLFALLCLYVAIHAGLLLQPDMQVAGAGSHAGELVWIVDRVDGALPQPAVLWFPMWTWRLAMLLWALWLAASLVRWLPWGFGAWTEGGAFKRLRPLRTPQGPPAAPEP